MLRKVLAFILLITTFNMVLPAITFAESNFVFSGKGWGHGLGLSQFGAKGYADNGRNYKQILAHYYRGTSLKATSSKTLRILIASSRNHVNFSARKDFKVYSEPLKKFYNFKGGHNYRSSIKANKIYIRDMTTSKDMGNFTQPLRLKDGKSLRLLNADDNGFKNNYYRGWLRLLISNTRLNLVNYVNSEQYLYGVVPREMPASWHIEALKAQSVAARSYAFATVKKNTFFDLYATVYSQVYGGMIAENSRTNAAVAQTAGKVLTYKGKIIQAFFHSSSGGYTENNEYVWGGSPISWLRSASSPYEGKYASWQKPYSFSSSYIRSKLGSYSSSHTWGVKGQLKDLVVVKRAVSPRVLSVRIAGTGGYSYVTGAKLRTLLGLRSTWFYVNGKNSPTTDNNNDDQPAALSVNADAKTIKSSQWLTIYGRKVPNGKSTLLLRYKRGGSKWGTAAKVKVNGSSYRIRVKPSMASRYVFSVRVGFLTSRVMTIYVR